MKFAAFAAMTLLAGVGVAHAGKAKPAPAPAPVAEAAGATGAKPVECQSHFKQEGSWLTGRTFSTRGELPAVSPELAYKRIYAGVMKGGLRVTSADKEMGAINAEMMSSLQGAQVSLPLTVLVEPSGKGSAIAVSMRTPSGYAISADGVRTSLCSVFEDAAR